MGGENGWLRARKSFVGASSTVWKGKTISRAQASACALRVSTVAAGHDANFSAATSPGVRRQQPAMTPRETHPDSPATTPAASRSGKVADGLVQACGPGKSFEYAAAGLAQPGAHSGEPIWALGDEADGAAAGATSAEGACEGADDGAGACEGATDAMGAAADAASAGAASGGGVGRQWVRSAQTQRKGRVAPDDTRATASRFMLPFLWHMAPRGLEPMNEDPVRRRLAALGALLFALGMVTGLWTAVVLTEKVKVAIPHLALAAHLNALLGCFWLLGLSYTLPMLSYGERGRKRLAIVTLVPAYGNWIVTVLASALGARGLEFTGHASNDLIAALLQGIVVLPTLVASFAWAWGFRRPAAGRPT